MTLTSEQVEFFHRNGYLPYRRILEPEEITALQEEYDRVFAEARRDGRYRNLSAPDGEGEQEMLQIMQVCERSLPFRRLLYDARILDPLEDLLGPNLMLFHDQALYKPPRTGGPVFWHQDNAYWRCSPPNLVSCWLTLDDAVRENGAMQVLPGSHAGLLSHETSAATRALLDSGGMVDESRAVVVEVPAGGCMFHHCQTPHHTAPNTTDGPRRAFAIHYMTPGTRGKDGKILPVGFARPVVRMGM